jgi:hypothetical protein
MIALMQTKIPILIMAFMMLTCAGMVYAAGQSSAHYTVVSDVISAGGGVSSSTDFTAECTVGQSSPTGDSSNDSYSIFGGFWNTVAGGLSILMGDINVDGIVDISDVILVLRIALGLDSEDPCGDMNLDNVINISDVIMTLRVALGLDTAGQC